MSKLSIIIPFYNAEKHIANCIHMVSKQTFTDYELLLINDGSTDGSLAIANNYAKKDSRIKVLDKKNSGAWDTRNYGIDNCSSDYIMFIDCDDYFSETWFEVMVNAIEEENYDLAICSHIDMTIYKNGAIKYNTIDIESKKILTKKEFHQEYIDLRKRGVGDTLWNKIYKTKIIRENNIRFLPLRRGEDVVFNLAYNNHVNSCFLVNQPCYKYRIESDNPPWNKYSEKYYYLVEAEYKMVRAQLLEWGVFDKSAKEFQATHLMNGFMDQLKNFLFNRELNNSEIMANIYEIIETECFKEGLENCKFTYPLNYLCITFIKMKKYRLALLIIQLRLISSDIKKEINSKLLYDEKL